MNQNLINVLVKPMKYHLFVSLIFSVMICSCHKNSTNTKSNVVTNQAELLHVIEASKLDKNALLLTPVEGSIQYSVKDGWEQAWSDNNSQNKNADNANALPPKHDCEESGLSFAKCVKSLVDAGKCVTVYKSGNTYYGDVVPCSPPPPQN